ncbi:MAG: acetyl-CoA carboxylase carboxyltransferase subunit alpha [Candidatus Eremiobacteraeota bacterium]|nr:acetyl-CoA carboxylase carboxyltransferase subunit alpha [Candidatus Eremiobacteraeota bacterium]
MKGEEVVILEIERPLLDLENKIEELRKLSSTSKVDLSEEIKALEQKVEELKNDIYSNLTTWDRVQIARHTERPCTGEYVNAIFSDFFELRGDRESKDDPAILAGLAKLESRTVAVIGHQKGKNTKDNLKHNFGMGAPEGFRKAGRVMEMAAKFGFPIITFIDTPGAYPGKEAEEKGQYEAISTNILRMMRIPTPIICVVIGEGGSGGALAIGVGDHIIMLENSIYSVISPEGCASIIWRDATRASEAAKALRITAQEILEMGLVDEIIPEPQGGAHRNPEQVFEAVRESLITNLEKLCSIPREEMPKRRYEKYRRMGVFREITGEEK